MTESYQLMSATWWRCSSYEIRDGFIGPAPGAEVERYDPWKEYEASHKYGVGRGPKPPYQALISLASEVDLHDAHGLARGGESKLTEFCEQYGLLGLLLQHMNVLPAGKYVWRWDQTATGRRRRPVWHSLYERSSGGWHREDYPGLCDKDLVKEVAPYFPNLPLLTARYPSVPVPLSTEFWTNYWEPIRPFMNSVLFLAAALARLAALNNDAPIEVGPLEFDSEVPLTLELDELNTLTSSVGSVLKVSNTNDGRLIVREWVFHSLAACMAMMMQHDLLGCANVRLCENCNLPFMSSSPKALYCSARCKNTAQKRHQRENKRMKQQGAKP